MNDAGGAGGGRRPAVTSGAGDTRTPALTSRRRRSPARTGRRPGAADTRGRILLAARAAFGQSGYEATTIRKVAAAAGVDPALVHHYFGTKQQLFGAAMQFPVDLEAVVPGLLAGPSTGLGERVVRFWLGLWDDPASRPVVLALLRSAATDPVAAAMLRQVLTDGPLHAMATAIDLPEARLRAALVGSQLVGLAMARAVVAVEPLASASSETLVRAVAPTVQRYLTGTLELGEPQGRDAQGRERSG